MHFICSGTDLSQAINIVVRTTGCKHIALKASKKGKRLILGGDDKGKAMLFSIPADVKEEGGFNVTPEALLGVCARRKELDVSLNDDESLVQVRSGNYAADIPLLPLSEIVVAAPESGIELEIANNELILLNNACAEAGLTAPYLDGSPHLPLLIRISESGTEIASMDTFHVACIKISSVTRDEPLDLLLPSGSLTTIANVAGDAAYRVLLSESTIYAHNENFKLSLPMQQIESYNLTREHASKLRNTCLKGADDAASVVVAAEELRTILGNVYAVCEQGVPLYFKLNKKGIEVGVTTTYGSVKEALDAKVTGTGKFAYDPALLSEVISKIASKDCTLHFTDRYMWVMDKTTVRLYFGVCLASGNAK